MKVFGGQTGVCGMFNFQLLNSSSSILVSPQEFKYHPLWRSFPTLLFPKTGVIPLPHLMFTALAWFFACEFYQTLLHVSSEMCANARTPQGTHAHFKAPTISLVEAQQLPQWFASVDSISPQRTVQFRKITVLFFVNTPRDI